MSCIVSIICKVPPGLSGAAISSSSFKIGGHCYSTSQVCSDVQRPKSETGRKPSMSGVSGDASTVPTLTAMKRGPGYRSSFSGTVATVFGASGAVGRAVCNRLGKSGTQFIVPYRGDHYEVMRLKVCGDLGQVLFTPYHLKDEESCRKAMLHSDVVINLIGREYETRNFKFADVNLEGPKMLARLARECGVKDFIHISSLNAREKPKRLFMPKPSNFLKTKWLGEKAVLEEFPDATIIRAADMFGTGDHYAEYYCKWWRTGWDGANMPLWKKGNYAVKAPLHISNMADAIMACLDNPSAKGVTFEAYGPERFLLADLVDWMHEVMHKSPEDWGYKRTDIRLDIKPLVLCAIMQNLPVGLRSLRAPTLDKLERSMMTDEVLGLPSIEDLGVKLNKVKDEMPWVLDPFRAFRFHTYYSLADRPKIHPLEPITGYQERSLQKELESGSKMLSMFGINTSN